MIYTRKISLFLTFAAVLLIIAPFAVNAQGLGFNSAQNIGAGAFGTSDLRDAVVSLVNVLLGFLGIFAVIIILWGGFKWMVSGGNEEKVTEARNTLVSGIIGIALIISSFAIAQFFILNFSSATGGSITF